MPFVNLADLPYPVNGCLVIQTAYQRITGIGRYNDHSSITHNIGSLPDQAGLRIDRMYFQIKTRHFSTFSLEPFHQIRPVCSASILFSIGGCVANSDMKPLRLLIPIAVMFFGKSPDCICPSRWRAWIIGLLLPNNLAEPASALNSR